MEDWFCLACDGLIDDEYDPVETFEERPISANNLDGLRGAVEEAILDLDFDAYVRGFETRREFMRKIVEAKRQTTTTCTGGPSQKKNINQSK